MKFAIILPVYNEAPTLERVTQKLSSFKDSDVVIVDDGSDDATPSSLERLKVKAVIRHAQNQGYGKSLMDGFDFAKENQYSYCVTMDGDEQHEPGFIPCLLEKLD